ncbi:MAG TPA: histidine kinase [Allosphingosinicella sp.]|nr:histidine kinase [Allosphingosinicella sp.]
MNAYTPNLAEEADARAERRRATFILIALFWVFAFIVLSVRGALVDTASFATMAPRRLITAIIGTGMCLAMAYALGRLSNRSFPERVLWGIGGALIVSALLSLFGALMNRVIVPVPSLGPFEMTDAIQWMMVWLGYFLAWTGTHLAMTYHWEAQDQTRRMAAMRGLAQEAQMAALRYQVNPHFLFNALNSVSALVLERQNKEAEAMLLNLSAFLRSTLDADASGTIALREEIALQRAYLKIEEARFEARMRVIVDVPEELGQAAVPALILQPLVENAIRHGVDRSEATTTIRIAAAREGDRLRLLVEDDGQAEGAPRPGTGLGLGNVGERLRAHFGERGLLQAGRREEGGYRAEIALPLEMTT